MDTGATVSLTCSWRLPAGRDAVISAAFYGTQGGLALHNVAGSFYDFTTERFCGTTRQTLHEPPDDWGGRAAVAWARQLATRPQFDPDVAHVVTVAEVLDAIYGREGSLSPREGLRPAPTQSRQRAGGEGPPWVLGQSPSP